MKVWHLPPSLAVLLRRRKQKVNRSMMTTLPAVMKQQLDDYIEALRHRELVSSAEVIDVLLDVRNTFFAPILDAVVVDESDDDGLIATVATPAQTC